MTSKDPIQKRRLALLQSRSRRRRQGTSATSLYNVFGQVSIRARRRQDEAFCGAESTASDTCKRGDVLPRGPALAASDGLVNLVDGIAGARIEGQCNDEIEAEEL